MKTTFFLAFLAINLITTSIYAQTKQKINKNSALSWTLKEKIKLNLNQLEDIHKIEFDNNNRSINTSGEHIVSGTTDAESELHAIINPTDTSNIIVSPISQANNSIHCPIYYSTDFGESWQTSSFINMPHQAGKISIGGGDPVFAADDNGRIFFSWIDLFGTINDLSTGNPIPMGIFWAYSDDKGETWTQPTHDTILLGQMSINMQTGAQTVVEPISDKQWMAVDKTGGLYHNNIYTSFVTIGQDDNGDAFYKIRCKTKLANSLEFSIDADITDTTGAKKFYFVQFSSLDVDNIGNIHVTFYGSQTGEETAIYHSVSTDGGISFSVPNKISNVKFNLSMLEQSPLDVISGINDDRTYPSPYVACDHNNGNIYMTWTAFGIDEDAGQKSEIYFSKSTDNGTNWSSPITVNNDNLNIENYYSSITVADNGDVKISWYDRRDDLDGNINTHYYMAISTNQGDSFNENTPVSSMPTDFSTIGSANNNFGIGEYNQILSTNHYTIPVWTDGRTNDGKLNLYAAFISNTNTGLNRIHSINENISFKNIYPNPAKNNVKIEYILKKDSKINISIIDEKGVLVKTIISNKLINKGENSIRFNISKLSSGLYYVVLESNFGKIIKTLAIQN